MLESLVWHLSCLQGSSSSLAATMWLALCWVQTADITTVPAAYQIRAGLVTGSLVGFGNQEKVFETNFVLWQ